MSTRGLRTCSRSRTLLNLYRPFCNSNHVCTSWENEFEGLAQLESWERGDEPVLQFHPLNLPNVLEKVIEHLGLQDRKNCRLVCRQWNEAVNQTVTSEYPICLKTLGDIVSFIKQSDSEHSQFPLRHFKLSNYTRNMEQQKLINLVEFVCQSVETLVLERVYLVRSCLHLPVECPKLESLALKFCNGQNEWLLIHSRPTRRTGPLKHRFKSLRHLFLDLSECRITDANILSITKTMEDILEMILTSSLFLSSLALRGAGDVLVNAISEILKTRASVLQTSLGYLEMNAYEISLQSWTQMNLSALSTLHILELDESVTTETFSLFMASTSGTLTTLMIDGICQGVETSGFQLYFPCDMTSLETLIVTEDISGIHAGSSSLIRRLPKLQVFTFSGNETLWMRYSPQFWQRFFRDGNGRLKKIINKDMVCFSSYVYIIDIQTFHNIRSSFPGLRVLDLSIDGELLRDVIVGMKDFRLEWLKLTYFETPGGILDFDSALTGLSVPTCTKLLQDNTYRPEAEELEELRTSTSLTDLK